VPSQKPSKSRGVRYALRRREIAQRPSHHDQGLPAIVLNHPGAQLNGPRLG
jgi:hypothetical protein